MAAESDRDRLPFEPSSKRKKPEKKASIAPMTVDQPEDRDRRSDQREDTKIPEVISRRMLRRMAAFSGVPTGLGIALFFVSYLLVTRHLVDLPNVVVLLTTLGCFGLGVLGLSYGALSASWEEATPGDWLGWGEFKVNFQRLTGSWQQAREERKNR